MYTCYIYIYALFFISTWFPDYDIHILWVGMQNHHFRKEKHWIKQDHFSIANRYPPISPIIDVQNPWLPQENWLNNAWFSTSKRLQESNWPELDDWKRGFPQEPGNDGGTHPRSILSDLRLEPKGSTAAVSETETAGGAKAGGIAMV